MATSERMKMGEKSDMKTGTYKGYETSLSEPGVLWIRFNRPDRKNGMTSVMKRELIETLTQAQMEDAVRVIVFTGSGDSFCAGDDLKGYATAMRVRRRWSGTSYSSGSRSWYGYICRIANYFPGTEHASSGAG